LAISFVKSYTFSPSTVIASGQVNQNFDEEAQVWQGLEAETKTIAKLKVDIDPTTALEVATKQYVDHYAAYRKPVLQYASATVVNLETGINGTSGQAQILFPDGNLRQDSTTGRINGNIAQVAALSGAAQSGLRTGTVANNTWYAAYMVKVSDSTTNMVMVFDTVLPLQANFATLNSNFGTNSWEYIGMIAYGIGLGTVAAITRFVQVGNYTDFRNVSAATASSIPGIVLGHTAGATSITWAYSAGTTAGSVPNHIVVGNMSVASIGSQCQLANAATNLTYASIAGTASYFPLAVVPNLPLIDGFVLALAASVAADFTLSGYLDSALGVGSNPLL
jgi:hypothetical protein